MRILIILLFIISGCGITTITQNTIIEDDESLQGFAGIIYDSIKRVWVEDNVLMIEVEQIPGFNFVEINPIFYEENIYLDTFHVSSGGPGAYTFEIDLLSYDLPDDRFNSNKVGK